MLRSITPRFTPNPAPMHAHDRLPSPWLAGLALRTMWVAFREALAAYREYEYLRSRGVVHEQALRASMGFGPPDSEPTPCKAKPLYCAGRA
jgi:hypothetical protein